MIETRPFIHDVSEFSDRGKTNFTTENFLDALYTSALPIVQEKLAVRMNSSLLFKLCVPPLWVVDVKYGVSDKNIIVSEDFTVKGIPVTHSQKVPQNGPIFDTLIYYDCRLSCILRTRETWLYEVLTKCRGKK